LSGTSNSITGIVANPYVNSSVAITAFPAGTVCAGGNVTFTATAVNGSPSPAYQWQVNGVNVGGNAATFSTTALANGDNVTCNLTANGAGCFTPKTSVSNSITMSVSAATGPPSVVTITASANNVKSGTPVTFTATSTLVASSYQWQVNGLNVGTNSAVFTSAGLKNGDIVTCVVLTSGTCIAPASSQPIVMIMLAPPNLHIVNTFTPNGDGVNDVWDIPDLSYYPDCLMSIYNRYGTMVYQSKGYNKAWDGTYNGRALPIGPYYYIIDPKSSYTSAKYSGCITIIK
jgi:gliding motility-associated-like protein